MMCDWPVWDGYHRSPPRMCGNGEHCRLGGLQICRRHFEMAIDSLVHEMQEQAQQWEAQGLPPGQAPAEGRIRWALEKLDRARRIAQPEPDQAPETRSSVVYFAERDGFVKIGTTRDLRGRMKALAAGGSMVDGMTVGPLKLLATVPGTRDNEQYFHKKFARLRVDPKREWFLFEAELREFVAGLKGAVLAGAS